MPDKNHLLRGMVYTGVVSLTLVWAGCSTGPKPAGGSASILSSEDQPLEEELLVGKWSLDGKVTRAANAKGANIADSLIKDLFGTSWTFSPGGLMTSDRISGDLTGNWKIDGDKLLITESPAHAQQTFEGSFRSGYLYLKEPQTGKIWVFQRGKS